MQELKSYTIKCSACYHKFDPNMCEFARCVECVVDKNPRPNCMGVESCREFQATLLVACKNYKSNSWDD